MAGPAQEGGEAQQFSFKGKKQKKKETPACSSQSPAHSENKEITTVASL